MVQGLRSLARKLTKTIPKRVKQKTAAAMEKGADEVSALQRVFVPKDDLDLLGSIGNKPVRSKGVAAVEIFAGGTSTIVTNSRGVAFQNARLQEFGTKNQPANPYFFPAWRVLRKRVKTRITRETRKAIREGSR